MAIAKIKLAEKQVDKAIVLASLQKEAQPLFKSIRATTINSVDSYKQKTEKMKALKEIGKLAAAKKASFIDPLKKLIADVNSLFNPFIDEVGEAEVATKNEILAYNRKLEAQKAKIEDDLSSGKIAKLSTALRKTEALEIKDSVVQNRKTWTAIEVDANLTPREFLLPNPTAIREALKAGRKVAGWKWEQVETIAI